MRTAGTAVAAAVPENVQVSVFFCNHRKYVVKWQQLFCCMNAERCTQEGLYDSMLRGHKGTEVR